MLWVKCTGTQDECHHECHESTPGTGRCWSPEQSSSPCWGGGIAVVTGCRKWEHQTFISSMVSEKSTVQLLKCAALKKGIWIGHCISTSSGTPEFPLPSISHLHNWKLQSSTARNLKLLNLNNHWRETAVIENKAAAGKMKTFKKRSPRSRKTDLVGTMLQRPALPWEVLAIQLGAFTGLVADC